MFVFHDSVVQLFSDPNTGVALLRFLAFCYEVSRKVGAHDYLTCVKFSYFGSWKRGLCFRFCEEKHGLCLFAMQDPSMV